MIAIAFVLAALAAAQTVALPMAAALFLVMVAWPLEPWLEAHMPRWVALILTVLVILAALAAFVTALTWSARVLSDFHQQHPQRLDELRRIAETQAQRFGVPMTVAVAITCRHFESTRRIAGLIGGADGKLPGKRV